VPGSHAVQLVAAAAPTYLPDGQSRQVVDATAAV
jgi:hypothetical protein